MEMCGHMAQRDIMDMALELVCQEGASVSEKYPKLSTYRGEINSCLFYWAH